MSICQSEIFLYTIRPGDTLLSIAKRYRTTIQAITNMNPGLDPRGLYVGERIFIRPECKDSPQSGHTAYGGISKAEVDLNNHLRMLWEQHVVWTRFAILSMVYNLPDANLVTKRLLQNPINFASLIRALYGIEVATRFEELLKNHLIIAAQLVKAAKDSNKKAVVSTEKLWYSNANEIATLLVNINPYWTLEEWKSMLYEHLVLTKAEVVDMLTKNYADGISKFDEIEKQALKMADMMAEGINNQFPKRFKE